MVGLIAFGPLLAQRWKVDRTTAEPISVPAPVRRLPAFTDLEYDDSSRVFGAVADLDHDGRPDFIIRSALSLCGNAACGWAIVDGATLRDVGALTGGTIYIDPAVHGYPTLHSMTSMAATSAEWATYTYKRGKYAATSRRTFTGRSLDSLTRALAGVPRRTK
jgi:hypothetical protein